jgi:predicted CxxxxCH...CXXCH cytochrome family protein
MTMALALGGCGDKNDKAVFSPDGGHSSDWVTTHKTAAKADVESCAECHGANLGGGVAKVSCFSTPQSSFNGFACHATNPIANTNCTSCHVSAPNGSAAPNRAGAHAKHLALAGITCATCHEGGGTDTANHGKSITVSALPVAYQAKSTSTFGYNLADGTCSGIICHGGLKTPNWTIGKINVATDCLKCHVQGTASQFPQYNSYYSGQWSYSTGPVVNLHQLHNLVDIPSTSKRVVCNNCHNVSKLALHHFSGLTTSAFEGTAASTIDNGTLIDSYTPYTTTAPSGSCTSSCHSVIGNNPRYWINP